MHTMLDLDEDVAARLATESRRRGCSLSQTVNELLRAGLLRRGHVPLPLDRYEPPVFDTGQTLIDVSDVSAALERLDS